MKPSMYGINPGKLKYDSEYIKNCSELELFIQVNSFYEPIKLYNEMDKILTHYKQLETFYKNTEELELADDFSNKIKVLLERIEYIKIKAEDIENIYAMDFCILQSARFGTNVVYNPNGRVNITDDFKNWYDNWKLYISSLDDNTLNFYRKCRYEGKHLDKFNLSQNIINTNVIEEIDTIKPYFTKSKEKSIKQNYA